MAPPAPSPRGVRGCGPTRPRGEGRVGGGSFCCRLLPRPPNSTPQPAFLRRLTDWFRAVAPGVLGVPKHLADVGMPEGPDPPVEPLQELVAVCFRLRLESPPGSGPRSGDCADRAAGGEGAGHHPRRPAVAWPWPGVRSRLISLRKISTFVALSDSPAVEDASVSPYFSTLHVCPK